MSYSVLKLLICSILFVNSILFSHYSFAEFNDNDAIIPKKSIEDKNLQEEGVDLFCSDLDVDEFPSEFELLNKVDSEESFFSFLDPTQDVISSGVESLAKTLDEFFSDDKVFYDTSGTYLRLRVDTLRDEFGELHQAGNLRLKLRLPNTSKKVKLTVESDADERQDGAKNTAEETIAKAEEKTDYFAGLQATLGNEERWQFKPSIGIRLSSGVEPYIKLRIKRKFQLNKWSVYWHETPYWFDSTGTGFDSSLEANKKITERDLFRTSTYASWTNERDYFELSQTFSMIHTLSKRRAVSYFVGAYGISEPTVHATHYLIGATYRQNIHKDYLFFELIPQMEYQKINNFESGFSLLFRIEFIFKK